MALSARALAQSAVRAGFEVHTVDLFADVDTASVAESTSVVDACSHGLDEVSLRGTLDQLRRRIAPDLLVPGSGFESRPALLEVLTDYFPHARFCGNAAATVAAVKGPLDLNATMAAAGIGFPATVASGAIDGPRWLLKAIGASGGAHVRIACDGERIEPGWYAQRLVDGRSMSALFLTGADGDPVHLLGVCEHWRAQRQCQSDFRHSGLVTVSPTASMQALLQSWAVAIRRQYRLMGLWGIDFICAADGQMRLIEINPRPTAAVELFEDSDSLFVAHIDSMISTPPRPALSQVIAAAAVYYAPRMLAVRREYAWPPWIADQPQGGRCIAAGEPVCTVLQRAESPARAVDMARERMQVLDEALYGADVI